MTRIVMPGILLAAQTGGEMPEGTILAFDSNLLVSMGIQMFNILLLTVALVLILYKPVKKFMQDRTERIKNEIEAARLEREEVFEQKEKYERLIAGVEKEREEILLKAHKKAMEKSDQMLFDARREAEAMYDRALEDLDIERKNIMDDVKKQIIEISMQVAGHFVEVSVDSETQNRYIEDAFTDWEGS